MNRLVVRMVLSHLLVAVVAALAMLHAVEAGHQAALMAPTEILAEQHYRKLATWLQPLGLEVAWLTGSLKKRDKEAAIARVALATR